MVTKDEAKTAEQLEAEASFGDAPKKKQQTFLFAYVSTAEGERHLVGPATKPELRTELDKLGDVTILQMIRGKEQKFSTKKTISFS